MTVALQNVGGANFALAGAHIYAQLFTVKQVSMMLLVDTRVRESDSRRAQITFKNCLRGSSIFQAAVRDGGDGGANQAVGGMALILSPQYSQFSQRKYHDPSGLGVVAALQLSTTCGGILVIMTYWTTTSGDDDNNALWTRIKRWLAIEEIDMTPLQWIQDQISKHIACAKAHKWKYIVMGDFNADQSGSDLGKD
jgi:hypothetical protein